MKVFQYLTIFLKGQDAEKFILDLTNNLPDTWERLLDREEYILKMSGDRYKQYCFSSEKNPDLPKASLWIANDDKGDLYVTNIVPKECGQLTIEEYNRILNSFVSILKKEEFEYTLTKADITIDDFVPTEVAQNLKRFSNAANKSTGYGHPCDFDRWLEFVMSYYNNRCKREYGWIQRWLHEEAGWPEETSRELASQLEYALDVLEYKDGRKLC